MSEGAMRAAIALAGLLVGVAVGWMVTRMGPAPAQGLAGGARIIVVGPTAADVHPPRVNLSKGNHHVLFWIGTHRDRELVIESEEQIFEGQTQQANGRWAMTCMRRMCYSDEIRDAVQPGATEYKYWQLFKENGQTVDEADGWIIIDR